MGDLSLPDADCVANPVACGVCATDEHCVSNAAGPRCETITGKCVACLPPPSRDNCGPGQACTIQQGVFKCVATCGSDLDCAKISGAGSSCCGGLCTQLTTDLKNCGGCGVECPTPNNAEAGCFGGHCIIGRCHDGFDDCNKSADDGCEVGVATDPTNCGACGKVCSAFRNGLPMCAASICSAVCAPGFAHCSARPEDGCEVDTTGDSANCGACGKVCTAPANGTAACDASKCGFRCKPGFADCNDEAKDGCEVSTQGDVNNCGHCGNVCPLRPQAQSATCTGGQCGNTCNNGFGDCDGQPSNGCESDLSVSLLHCGSCGAGCLANHGKATCGQGVCSLSCDNGWFDCNQDGTDGCESNPQSDGKNCGACNNLCPQNLPFCVKGMCSAVNPAVVFSEAFVGGQDAQAQCLKWQQFQSNLLINFTQITISGSLDMVGVTCNQANEANTLCTALHNNQTVSVACNGRTWRTGTCGSGLELSASGNICSCDGPPGYLVRPCINAGNPNWGGVNSTTCSGPSQTMTVTCQ